jgi:hypothetical protein
MKKINQDQQIKSSDVYDDTVSSGATMESAATNLEDDLNSIRSQLKGIAGSTNWYDVYPGATDSAAIHDNASGEIAALTLKATLVGTDVILVEDSSAGNAKKYTTVSGIPHNSLSGYDVNRHIDWTAASAGTIHATNYSSTDSNAVHVGVDAEIYWIATKVTPVSGDWLLIEDSQSTLPKKKISVGSIPHNSLSGYEANRHIDWTAAAAGTIDATNYLNTFVKVSASDTTPAVLLSKISGGSNISVSVNNPGLNEALQLSVTGSQAGFDSTAIHDNVSGEISLVSSKAVPTGSDLILVEDVAAANAKRKITIGSIPHDSLTGYSANRHIDWTAPGAGTIDPSNYSAGGTTDSNAIHGNAASEISILTAKAAPTASDMLIIEDAAAANVKKKITIGTIPHDSLSGFVANEHIDWTAASAGTIDATNYLNTFVKVSAVDTTPGYLNGKLVAGANVSLTPSGAGNETLTVAVTGTKAGIDSTAIHNNVASEISVLTSKATPTGADLLLIEDAASTNVKRRITISAIPHDSLSGYSANRHIDWTAASAGTIDPTNYSSVDSTAIHKATAGEIAALTLKATLVGADVILVEDSAAANAKKRTTVAGIPHNSLSGYEANRHIDWTAVSAGTIHATNYLNTLVKVSASDTTPGYLSDKLTVGANIALTTWNSGANEYIAASVTGTLAGFDSTAIHDNVASEISVLTLKAVPISGDILLIEDSAATNTKKRITIGSIPHDSLSGFVANEHLDWTAASVGTIHATNYAAATYDSVIDNQVGAATMSTNLLTNINDNIGEYWRNSAGTAFIKFGVSSGGLKQAFFTTNTFSVDNGGTQIDLYDPVSIDGNGGEVLIGAHKVEFTGAATIKSTNDLGFIDSFKTASTDSTKIKFSATTAEWTEFYSKFSTASLIKAISSSAWKNVKLASDFVNSTTAVTNVTGWTFTPAANKTYEYEVKSLCTTAAVTTGIQFGSAAGMGGTITHGSKIEAPLAPTTSEITHMFGTSITSSTSTGTPTTAAHLVTVKGMIIAGATPSGSLQLTLRSEVATSAVTIKAGSIFRWREIV